MRPCLFKAKRIATGGCTLPKRALAEHRPWLLTSLVAALAFYFLSDERVGGLFLIVFKGSACAALAAYALARHGGRDGWLLAGVMVFSAAGDVAMELGDETWGGALFLSAHLLAIVLYRLNPRPSPSGSQRAAAWALVIAVPLIAYLLTSSAVVTLYALGLGAMGGSAWASRFGRYRVGLGALLFVASDLLIFARLGSRLEPSLTSWLVWPLYYTGQLLICTGVVQKLRREPAP